jgi:predicted XRE-type DNA-binding protein
MPKSKIEIHESSGNIFADLGLPDSEELLLKSQIVVELHRGIKSRKLTQTAAAKLIGIAQPDLSNVLRGRFSGFSTERLMRMLTAFGRDIDIVVRKPGRGKRPGRIRLLTAAE